jgi:hypothetical protein
MSKTPATQDYFGAVGRKNTNAVVRVRQAIYEHAVYQTVVLYKQQESLRR